MRLRLLAIAGALGCFGCGERPRPARSTSGGTPPAPADSLVATAPGGAQIWFTLARTDSGPHGRCVARAVEIRRGGARIPVPLLYTSTAPELLGDTAFRARLSERCHPGDSYVVDLRTGRPVRERT